MPVNAVTDMLLKSQMFTDSGRRRDVDPVNIVTV